MKKFLFTLAAILMAGSMCAGEYFVCQDFEIPQDKIGKNVNIDVKAHFDAYVSAWLTEIFLPENVSLARHHPSGHQADRCCYGCSVF